MEGVKNQTRRQSIMNFYRKNSHKGQPYAVDYFKKLKVNSEQVYRAIARVERGDWGVTSSAEGHQGAAKIVKNPGKTGRRGNNKNGYSLRGLGRKMGICHINHGKQKNGTTEFKDD